MNDIKCHVLHCINNWSVIKVIIINPNNSSVSLSPHSVKCKVVIFELDYVVVQWPHMYPLVTQNSPFPPSFRSYFHCLFNLTPYFCTLNFKRINNVCRMQTKYKYTNLYAKFQKNPSTFATCRARTKRFMDAAVEWRLNNYSTHMYICTGDTIIINSSDSWCSPWHQ
jgi:hypothetical protein